MSTRWREHEQRAAQSSLYKGYNLRTQKKSSSTGKRPDFFGIGKGDPKDRIVGDAKWSLKARKAHVDQVNEYKRYPFFAKKAALQYPQNAGIPKSVREYAKAKNVKIVRTSVPKVKELIGGLIGRLLGKKGYPR